MSSKKATKSTTAKKTATSKAVPSHPTWVDMIKECIAIHTEDARIGVSRPQIKKFVESQYKLEIGAAQTTQLAKAISTGVEKGIFILPKGLSGRVKLAPKSKPVDASAKENKPASKASNKPASIKPASKAKTSTAKKPSSARTKAPAPPAKAKAKAPAPTTKKAPSKAKAATAKKTTRRAPAKKAVTGTAKAAKKAPAKKKAATKKATASPAKPAAKVPRKSPTKRS